MPEKKDWIIFSQSEEGTDYANMVRNKTKEGVGRYIKTHVDELFGHFECMSDYDYELGKVNDNKKILDIKKKLEQKDEDCFEYCETVDDYNSLVAKITKELSKLSDIDVFNGFFSHNDQNRTGIMEYEPHLGERTRNVE